ncbi:uncharacterized protein PAC_12463 [Phialocephala subalpina]|uniref:Protein kinase domain-containing protein n=1 Tax=Phialocephala subalpina TaxID=576137 RepID=A0A1L7XC41_9HELO|nr:uncharacterized protein PAC_12463 [Phialocephala subalpina]
MASSTNSNFNPFVWMRCPPMWDTEVFTYNYVCNYNGKIFDILLSPNTLLGYDAVNSIESQYLQRLEAVSSCDGNDDEVVARMLDESDRVSAEIETPVLKASQSLMQDLAPETEDLTRIKPLRSWMYPEIINLQLVTEHGKLKAVKRDDLPTRDFHPPITDPQVLGISLPYHQVSDVQFLTELYPYVYKILVNGQIMCAKVTRHAVHDSMSDEIRKLYQIQTTNFDSLVRVPQLKGLIVSHTGIVGFLIDYIASLGYHLEDALRCAKATSGALIEKGNGTPLPEITISKAQKEKWSRQIEETLEALHTRNIIWGDAKMANILIDEVTDNAWVVDFGGGNTEGWIDLELHGSVAGDIQALERIKKELADD